VPAKVDQDVGPGSICIKLHELLRIGQIPYAKQIQGLVAGLANVMTSTKTVEKMGLGMLNAPTIVLITCLGQAIRMKPQVLRFEKLWIINSTRSSRLCCALDTLKSGYVFQLLHTIPAALD
jgi:hypothetical protein